MIDSCQVSNATGDRIIEASVKEGFARDITFRLDAKRHVEFCIYSSWAEGGRIYEVAPDAMKAIEGPNSYQFILHAALDMVDEVEWATPTLFS